MLIVDRRGDGVRALDMCTRVCRRREGQHEALHHRTPKCVMACVETAASSQWLDPAAGSSRVVSPHPLRFRSLPAMMDDDGARKFLGYRLEPVRSVAAAPCLPDLSPLPSHLFAQPTRHDPSIGSF